MKVLFVTPCYYPNLLGGSERSLKIIAEGLAKKGINVIVLSFDSQKGIHEENYNLVKVVRIKKINIIPKTLAHNLSLLKYRKIIEKEKPDIIHVYNTWHIPAASFLRKIAPVVATLNNHYPLIATAYTKDNIIEKGECSNLDIFFGIKNTLKGNIIKRYILAAFYTLYSIPIRKLSKRVDYYVVYANSVAETYRKWGFDMSKSTMIFSPFELEKKVKTGKREKDSVLYVGGAREEKGFYDFLEAASLVKNKKVKFYCVGINHLPNAVQNFVKENKLNIKFIGKLDHDKLFKYYTKATILVQPSLLPEPFSRIWIEALQHNTPIISSDNPTALEILGGGALFYRRRHPEELAKKIDNFISGKEKINPIMVKKRLFSSRPIDKLVRLYNKVISET